MTTRTSLIFFLIFVIAAFAVSCSKIMPERQPYNGGRVKIDLPAANFSDPDPSIDKDTSLVISVTSDSQIFLGKDREAISDEQLRYRLRQLLEKQTESNRRVYLAGSIAATYRDILKICDTVREAGLSQIGLVAIRRGPNEPSRFLVDLPPLTDPNEDISNLKPNPLMLVVSITPELKLKLNQDDYGSVNDSKPLSTKLLEIFKLRTENRAYKPGVEMRTDLPESQRIEKTLIIKGTRSLKYGDVIKVIDAVKGSGASPIVLQLDDLAP